MRRCTSAAGVCIMVFLAACGDDERPGLSGPDACQMQAVFASGAVQHAGAAEVRAALLDAAERLAAGMPAGSRAELRAALRSVEAGGAGSADAICNAIRLSRQILAAHSEDAATAPDRAALLLTLDFAETYFAASR